MATFNKGGIGGEFLGAKDMEGPKVWAVYPHWKGDVQTKDYGLSPAIRCEVYELTEGWLAVRAGSAVFFQTVLLKLPLEEWSVGQMVGPATGQKYYDLVYPDNYDGLISEAMAGLPEHPDVPEASGPSDGDDTFPAKPATTDYNEEPF